jgi:hypothetical protein
MTYIRKCAWCKKIVGTKVVPSGTAWPDKITHTICPSCSTTVIKDLAHIQQEDVTIALRCGYESIYPLHR